MEKTTRRQTLKSIGATAAGIGIVGTEAASASSVDSENLKQKLASTPVEMLQSSLGHPTPGNTDDSEYSEKGAVTLELDETTVSQINKEPVISVTKIPTDSGTMGITSLEGSVLAAMFQFKDLDSGTKTELDHLWDDVGYDQSTSAFLMSTEQKVQFGREVTESEEEQVKEQVAIDANEIVAVESSDHSGYRVTYDGGYMELDTDFVVVNVTQNGGPSVGTNANTPPPSTGGGKAAGGHQGFWDCAGEDIFLCTSDITTTYSSCSTAGSACSISVSTGPYGWAACAAVFATICAPAIALHGMSDSCGNVFNCATKFA